MALAEEEWGAVIIQAEPLRDLVAEIFAAAGCSAEESARVARYLVESNLTGHESHGVIRVPRYIHWLREGKVRPGQSIEIITENAVLAVVDGCLGFGQTIGEQAVRLGIDKVAASGVSVIALRNSGHLGRIGDWAEMAAAAGVIALHFVNTTGIGLLVAPFGGIERRMSTNPVAIGVPMADGPPLMLDCATSIVAEGKILNAMSGGNPLPEGALIDADGTPSTDPALIYGSTETTQPLDLRGGRGAIRAMGEHKGSGLAFMCEVLAGALTGSGCAREDVDCLANAMLSVYLDPKTFDVAGFLGPELERYVRYFKSAKPMTPGGEVLCPGEVEHRNRVDRLAHGVPLPDATWRDILETARDVGFDQPRIDRALDAAQ